MGSVISCDFCISSEVETTSAFSQPREALQLSHEARGARSGPSEAVTAMDDTCVDYGHAMEILMAMAAMGNPRWESHNGEDQKKLWDHCQIVIIWTWVFIPSKTLSQVLNVIGSYHPIPIYICHIHLADMPLS